MSRITHPTLNSASQVLVSLGRLVKAFSILEKYGCNLTSPGRPKFWRSVKHNNPVFRTTVDAVKVGTQLTSHLLNHEADCCSNWSCTSFCTGRPQSSLSVRLHQSAGGWPQFPRRRLRTRQRKCCCRYAWGHGSAYGGGHADKGSCFWDHGWASAPQLISNFVFLCHLFRAATLTQNTSGKSSPPSSFRCVEIITAYYDTGHPITQQQNQAWKIKEERVLKNDESFVVF